MACCSFQSTFKGHVCTTLKAEISDQVLYMACCSFQSTFKGHVCTTLKAEISDQVLYIILFTIIHMFQCSAWIVRIFI